jgi:chemotaxis protein histidine kinase CheA
MRQNESYRRAFENLRLTFLEAVPEKIGEIRRGAEDVEQGGHSQEAIENLHSLVHRLVGSAAIYGLGRLSDTARVLEARVNALLVMDGASVPALPGELIDLASELDRIWSQESRPGGARRKRPRRSRFGRL